MAVAYVNAGTFTENASSTTVTPSLPASLVTGNLLVAVATGKASGTAHTISGSGWTTFNINFPGTNFRLSVWYRIVDGTEAAPTITVNGSAVANSGQIFQFSGTSKFPAPGFATPGSGTGTTHTSTGGVAPFDGLILSIDVSAADTALGTSSGWTEQVDNGGATSATRIVLNTQSSTMGVASSNFSATGANASWMQIQTCLADAKYPLVPLTGIATSPACVGPFKLPIGDYITAAINTAGAPAGADPLSGSGGSTAIAQSLTNPTSNSLVIVSAGVLLGRSASVPAGDTYAEITDTGPNGTVLATSNSIANSSLTAANAPTTFIFPSPPTIAGNATFALVLRRTIPDSNTVTVTFGSGSFYAGGSMWAYNGTTWTAGSTDWVNCKINTLISSDMVIQTAGVNTGIFGRTSAQVNSEKVGQTFFTTTTSLIGSAVIQKNTNWGTPTDGVFCEIYADSGGLPTGVALGTSDTISAATWQAAGDGTNFTFTFSTPILVSAATTYVLVVSRTGSLDDTNAYAYTWSASSVYANGQRVQKDAGGGWSAASGDLVFTITTADVDAFFIIGKISGVNVDKVVALKSFDPTTSFSTVATSAVISSTSNVNQIAAYQVNEIVYLAVASGDGVGAFYKVHYLEFNLASGTFSNVETVLASADTSTSAGVALSTCSITVRSDGTVVILYNGARVANMGSSYSRVVFARRNAAGSWSLSNQAVDAGGTVDCSVAEAVLGSSNRSHFFWLDHGTATLRTRTLTLADSLGTAANTSGAGIFIDAISYNNAGTQKIRVVSDDTSCDIWGYDSADSPTFSIISTASNTTPARFYNDGADLWFINRSSSDSDLYARKSTNDGSSFGSFIPSFTGSVGSSNAGLSVDGNIYKRGYDYVIPYVVLDSTTLKYNEHIVRSDAPPPPTERKQLPVNRSFAVARASSY